MHLGNFILQELKKQKKTIAEAAKAVNKTNTGVRKDLAKESLHQSVIETYANFLGLNLYRVLAEVYEGKPYKELVDREPDEFKEQPVTPTLQKPEDPEVLSVNISVPAEKREAFLQLLMS
jgi:hypothetical protein